MRQVLLKSCWKQFLKIYLQTSQKQFIWIECVEICKKKVNIAWYSMFPSKFGQILTCVKSYLTRAENTVLQ